MEIKERRKASATRLNGSETAVYSAPAVDKALDILELLGDASQAMNLTGISDALGRTKQELFRVLQCLHGRGYLVRDEAQGYRLSTKLFELGSRHASTQTLIARALPHMERLSAELEESCHLNIVVQNRMLVAARVECSADVMLTVRIGAMFELHRRTSGLVALAMLPPHRQAEYWQQCDESTARIETLKAQLEEIREQGYGQADSTIAVGVQDCAAPLLGSGSQLLGVLCVSHIRRTDEFNGGSALAQAVIACARAISAEFGPVEGIPKRIDKIKERETR
jgi:DNA-binding IclR family transcriptional regulator